MDLLGKVSQELAMHCDASYTWVGVEEPFPDLNLESPVSAPQHRCWPVP